MKLLCDSAGLVLARYSDESVNVDGRPLFTPVAGDGQVLITVPDTVAIPEVVVRVVFSEEKEPEFVVESLYADELWSAVKKRRNDLLKESDWICSITDYLVPNKDGWIVYRQALRDITQQTNPYRISWPSMP